MNKKLKYALIITAAILLALIIGCVVYICGGYEADEDARAALVSDDWVTVEQLEDRVVFSPAEPVTGFIFYPGGNVEHIAYAPLMNELARHGILCVLVEMPLDLAVLDKDAAEGIPEQYPQIQNWYIGGHALGGRIAAEYVADHTDTFDGLVLLAAYSTADLSGTDLEVISIYGDRDEIMDMDKYERYRKELPSTFTEEVIEGGNHANFGSYGDQTGDGNAILSSYVQTKITAETLLEAFTKP